MLFTELKTQNNEINSKYVIKEISDNLLLIPDPLRWHVNKCLCNKRKGGMDLGSVINDCGDKHYNKGVTLGYLYV